MKPACLLNVCILSSFGKRHAFFSSFDAHNPPRLSLRAAVISGTTSPHHVGWMGHLPSWQRMLLMTVLVACSSRPLAGSTRWAGTCCPSLSTPQLSLTACAGSLATLSSTLRYPHAHAHACLALPGMMQLFCITCSSLQLYDGVSGWLWPVSNCCAVSGCGLSARLLVADYADPS